MSDIVKHPIVAVLALPPPTHGQAVVNQAVVDALSAANAPLKVINVSPGSLRRGVGYHARRMSVFAFKAVPAILGAKGGLLYSVVEPGFGMSYNFLTLLLSRARRLKIVLHHHSGLYSRTFDRRFDLLSRLAGKGATHVALDEAMARDLKTTYPHIQKILVAHNATHISRPVLRERGDRRLTCGFMSNLDRGKGLDIFLNALRAGKRAGLTLQAVLAGPPASGEAEEMIALAKAEFGEMLEVRGPVENASKDMFFRSIDIFLFPSRLTEGQPLVLLEAMSYGVPIIASDRGYCAELVGEAGVSAPIFEFEKQAASFMTRCQNDAGYLIGMRTKARARYEALKAEADRQLDALISLICSPQTPLVADAGKPARHQDQKAMR